MLKFAPLLLLVSVGSSAGCAVSAKEIDREEWHVRIKVDPGSLASTQYIAHVEYPKGQSGNLVPGSTMSIPLNFDKSGVAEITVPAALGWEHSTDFLNWIPLNIHTWGDAYFELKIQEKDGRLAYRGVAFESPELTPKASGETTFAVSIPK